MCVCVCVYASTFYCFILCVCKCFIDQMTHMIHAFKCTVMIVMMETAPSLCPLSNAFGACDQSAQGEHVAGWNRWLRQTEFNKIGCLHL